MAKNIRDVELFLFDLDGTVYIGDREIEGSFAAVNRLREMGKRICFFTNNSSRMHTDYIARLNHLGLRVWSDEIYTSGQVTCEYLLDNYRGKKVFLLGNDRLRAEFEMYGIELSEDEPDLAVIGFDTSLTYDRLYKFCRFVHDGLPFIATHPDNFCPAEGCPMPDVGAMLSAIRLTVGRDPDLVMGKPHKTAGERIADGGGQTVYGHRFRAQLRLRLRVGADGGDLACGCGAEQGETGLYPRGGAGHPGAARIGLNVQKCTFYHAFLNEEVRICTHGQRRERSSRVIRTYAET